MLELSSTYHTPNYSHIVSSSEGTTSVALQLNY